MKIEEEWLAKLIENSLEGNLVKAESDLREALAELEAKFGRGSERLLPVLESLAGLLWCTNRWSEASVLIDRIAHIRGCSGLKVH